MAEQKNIVIGTAGHIDHGKTTLIKALTGVDPDRLKEEKTRGITIDLGFAHLVLPGGSCVAVIDVPGHEKFVKNMLAGTAGIDIALLIIAADEGVMPQTREHLDIIRLLEIQELIVVITKTDLVEKDLLELVDYEVKELLGETPYQEAPVVKVAAVTGFGTDKLLEVIEKRIEKVQPRGTGYAFARLPIDRVFTVQGFGVVVTGTLFNGEIKVRDILESPLKKVKGRVRSLQIHGKLVTKASTGHRVAVNLAGVDRNNLKRGDVLVSPGALSGTSRIDVSCHLLKSCQGGLKQHTRVRFYQGTRETMGRVSFFDRDVLEPGEEAFMQIVLEEPVVVVRGDTYIIRSYSPVATIGGGRIIEPMAKKHKKKDGEILQELLVKAGGDKKALLWEYLKKAKGIMTAEQAAIYLGIDKSATEQILWELMEEKKLAVLELSERDKGFLAEEKFTCWRMEISREINHFLKEYPLEEGLDKEVLRSKVLPHLSGKEFNALLSLLAAGKAVRIIDGRLVQPWDYRPDLQNELYQKAKEVRSYYEKMGWQAPAWETVKEELSLGEKHGRQILQYLLRENELVQLAHNVYISAKAVEEGKRKLEEWLRQHKEMTVAQARDILGSSRKVIVPFLEHLDEQKFTLRQGDKRVLHDQLSF